MQILVFRKVTSWGLYDFNFIMPSQFHPLYPNVLVLNRVQKLAFFVTKEIVNSEDNGYLLEFLAKLQAIANVLTQGNRDEVLNTHHVNLGHAFLTNGCESCFSLQRSTISDET